ncbi:hypothetical protein [Actinophytocola sp.]|uniref:hypothetical protein n=1 Tax=Actinophytocola sp. TaxID=1872138 RepID=UPI002ED13B5D
MTPRIEVAERPGVGSDGVVRPSEDVVVVLPHAVVLLDGATAPDPALPTGIWYASRLAGELAGRLAGYPDTDLEDLVAASIKTVARDRELTPGRSPSSTVAVLRWNETTIEGLVLGNSPIVVFIDDGVTALTGHDSDGLAEADPDVAYSAAHTTWPRAHVTTALMASDGVTLEAVPDWYAIRELAVHSGPEAVLNQIPSEDGDDQALVVAHFA